MPNSVRVGAVRLAEVTAHTLSDQKKNLDVVIAWQFGALELRGVASDPSPEGPQFPTDLVVCHSLSRSVFEL